ncbi:hypothetical protein GGTG_13682 [Gaeumannomyces tritici R3-111a-1]|uniref:3'-5' exonuclease domain-containing protein n=1 Tax=Gaeumannomyces tritici (strain R3-111a-1) TaxID=644352 RepID=J3PJJ6_GAET3|nr:hypothetical protein GGTG_13682 [Gaeumannomyces tritici R3-111a-1]EJT68752.1 hypothetical protein GGTG_13682 [Gaeumannomyces tritici R3-111a-1]
MPAPTTTVDLEGRNLSRNGTLDILTALVRPTKKTSLIDVHTLGDAAFTTANGAGRTLKGILEDPDVPKYFWDVRNDANALWSHHRVRLAGVTDVQLLENAARRGNKTRLWGLSAAVERHLNPPQELLSPWLQNKKEIAGLMRAGEDVFSCRPLTDRIVWYCAGDVAHLPALRGLYAGRLNARRLERVRVESVRRVDEACGPDYEPQSEDKTFGPWGSRKTRPSAARPIASNCMTSGRSCCRKTVTLGITALTLLVGVWNVW